MKTTLNNLPDAWKKIDQLISLLRSCEVTYLVGLDHSASPSHLQIEQISPVELIRRLAQCDEYPRVRDASIALFLLHHGYAQAFILILFNPGRLEQSGRNELRPYIVTSSSSSSSISSSQSSS